MDICTSKKRKKTEQALAFHQVWLPPSPPLIQQDESTPTKPEPSSLTRSRSMANDASLSNAASSLSFNPSPNTCTLQKNFHVGLAATAGRLRDQQWDQGDGGTAGPALPRKGIMTFQALPSVQESIQPPVPGAVNVASGVTTTPKGETLLIPAAAPGATLRLTTNRALESLIFQQKLKQVQQQQQLQQLQLHGYQPSTTASVFLRGLVQPNPFWLRGDHDSIQQERQPESVSTNAISDSCSDGLTYYKSIETSVENRSAEPKPCSSQGRETTKMAKKTSPHGCGNCSSPRSHDDHGRMSKQRGGAAYDQLRNATFGSRSDFPMHMTGDGALDRNGITALNTGFVMILPSDKQRRNVVCVDLSRLEGGSYSRSSLERGLFYMFSVVAQQEEGDCHETVLLYRTTSRVNHSHSNAAGPPHRIDDGNDLDKDAVSVSTNSRCRVLIESFLKKLFEVLPLQLHRLHVFSSDDQNEDTPTTAVVAGPPQSRGELPPSFAFHSMTQNVVLHSSCCWGDEIPDLMQQFFVRALPKFCGGDWGLEKFFQWQELRTRMEWQLPLDTRRNSHLDDPPFPAIRPPSSSSFNSRKNEDHAPMTLSERKRRLNVIHSRRKRSRARMVQELLQDEVGALQRVQKELLATHQHLEKCLASAHGYVAQYLTKTIRR